MEQGQPNLNTSYVNVNHVGRLYYGCTSLDLNTSYVNVNPITSSSALTVTVI